MVKLNKSSQFEVTNMLIDFNAEQLKLTSSQKLILIQLSRFVDGSMTCYPTKKVLGDRAGVNERTVTTAINKFEKLKYITVTKFKCDHTGYWRNAYKLNLEKLPSYAKPTINDKNESNVVAFG